MNERQERIGTNEVLYREVNERVLALNEEFELLDDDPLQLVCECGRADCAEPIRLTLTEYEHVRSDPAQFAIAHGHEFPDVEQVVERHERYDVVRKNPGVAEELAIRNA